MEAWSGIIKKAVSCRIFEGLQLPNNGPIVSHFLFADDVIVIEKWSEMNVRNISRLLRGFYLISGLRVNLLKSSLYGVGTVPDELSNMALILKCKVGTSPFTYLGLTVGANMNLVKNWKPPVIDAFKKRLMNCKAKTLSIGGRVTLIKSVLESLPTYFFSLYRAPAQVINELERIRKQFLWGGSDNINKIHWV